MTTAMLILSVVWLVLSTLAIAKVAAEDSGWSMHVAILIVYYVGLAIIASGVWVLEALLP